MTVGQDKLKKHPSREGSHLTFQNGTARLASAGFWLLSAITGSGNPFAKK